LKDIVIGNFRRHFNTLSDEDRDRKYRDLDEISAETDLWVAFQRLNRLGKATYEESIRNALSYADKCSIPQNYLRLFTMGKIRGVVTLNLDRLVARAFADRNQGQQRIVEFCGNKCHEYFHVLHDPNPFILNAHGVVDNVSSWILQQNRLNWLFNEYPAYQEFVRSILATNTVVFVGVKVDDPAINTHFDRLTKKGISVAGHYWITDRSDSQTNDWAETRDLRVIRYNSYDNHVALGQMLDDLSKYIPQELNIDPVIPSSAKQSMEPLPEPAELEHNEEEIIRVKLNEHAKEILQDGRPDRYREYESFRAKYDKCIHKCWYVGTNPPDNVLMGYRLTRELPKEGAFGRIFEALSPNGDRVALKLLREEVRRKPEMIQSFRRGVRAMKILSNHDVKGMVGYMDCSEIPAFAVMEFIDGPDLHEAVEHHYLDDWNELLRFACELVDIIRHAHMLPERVLHRDIRPANVMLKDYHVDTAESHVVVLDFDLSWHRSAQEVSITQGPATHGYLAPELTEQGNRASTRNAAVDSFGLGMTLYFMRTGRDPIYMQHRHKDWNESVKNRICQHTARWQSLPVRFADLILFCTRDVQASRYDVKQIQDELQRLAVAEKDPESVRSPDLLCYELAWRCDQRFIWDYDRQEAKVHLPTGIVVVLSCENTEHRIAGRLEWHNEGDTCYQNVSKYIKQHAESAVAVLRKGGWSCLYPPKYGSGGTEIEFNVECSKFVTHLSNLSQCLAEAMNKLSVK
jgi:serine/threonine protein kinase